MPLTWGPQKLSHAERVAIAQEIAERMKVRFHLGLIAIGLYGSLARGQDGSYSDIEIFGVLQTDDYKQRYEWCTTKWKAEVDLYGKQTLRDLAARVDERWPLTHSAFQTILPLDDPEGYFTELSSIVQNRPESLFLDAIKNLLVDDVFEHIGKIRNIQESGDFTALPFLIMKLAQAVAMIIGLANRQCYTTGTSVIPEALALPDQPIGFRELGQVVLTGNLSNSYQLSTVCEDLWQGLNLWTQEHGYHYVSQQRIPF